MSEIAGRHLQLDDVSGQRAAAVEYLRSLRRTVRPVEEDAYKVAKDAALSRIERRDADDWPVLAVALVLGTPIWTEDNDFFGTGVATWTTDRVELYLRTTED